jgi:plasmid stabilization system protein ParE
MAFEVRTTPEAEQDAAAILGWLLEQHAGETGLRWFMRMDEAIASLAEMPQRCKLAPENKSFPFEVRELLYAQKPHVYRILFTIEGAVVFILHIRHGRRLPLKMQEWP